ncbi:serine hydrolase domain-containing protein [Amycolatopsis aidingensis]|uniref:serine hydrolase domain-containing protein n=1 Tax=Amycolatopsis aidingensis TaxID=2842453 RepID=UPI001C0D896D|nr:serine hydrolase domain-containing protein [Amycolatopsis aidingensis]
MRSRRITRTLTAALATALAALLGATIPAVAGQRADPLRESVDGLVRAGFPAVVAYARDGTRQRRLSAGTADTATGEPATVWHRFRIASNTKAFTATVLLQLVGEGKLSLVDTVHELLPGVLRGNGYRPGRITLRQLLNHTSGVYDPASTPEFFAPYLEHGDRGHVIPPREVVRRAGAHGPAFAPGERTGYSNTNYLLAGMIIERVTGNDVVTEIRDRILWPLGLHRTTFPVNDPRIAGPHLHGYDLAGEDLTVFSPSYDWTAGAMISTVDDLARFQRALLNGELLEPEQQRLLESGGEGYGLGVEIVRLPCGQDRPVIAVGGTGGGPGYTSIALSTADGKRQLVLAATVFDLAVDVGGEAGRQPWPVSPMAPVLAALCG